MQSPLTAGQLEIWISQVLEPSSPVYNVGDYYEITGAVDAKLLEAAARTAVDESGSLGARFLVATDGTPYQELGPAEWPFEVLDMSERPDPDAEAVAWMRAEMARPVDLTCGSLLAGALIKVSRDRHFWYRRFHHIITDGHGTAAVARRTAPSTTRCTPVPLANPTPSRRSRPPSSTTGLTGPAGCMRPTGSSGSRSRSTGRPPAGSGRTLRPHLSPCSTATICHGRRSTPSEPKASGWRCPPRAS